MAQAKTEMGQDRTLDEEKLFALLSKFYETGPEEDKTALRNAIILELEPLVKESTRKYEPYRQDIDDLRQEVRIDLMVSLTKWNPSRKGTIGGFFRTLVHHKCYDYLNADEKLRDRERTPILVDEIPPTEEETKHLDFSDMKTSSPFEGEEHEAYLKCLSWLPKLQYEVKGLGHLQSLLCKEYGVSMRRAKRIIDFAKIEFRKELLARVNDIDLAEYKKTIPGDSLFSELFPLLENSENIQDIIKLFSGLQVSVPVAFSLEGE